jgi:hypothetical protein
MARSLSEGRVHGDGDARCVGPAQRNDVALKLLVAPARITVDRNGLQRRLFSVR